MAYHPSLDYFLVITKHMNITKAAKELHISQQSLSIYLKRLEEFYNSQLFYRKPVLKLTPTGEILKETAESIQSLYDQTYQKLSLLNGKPRKLIFGCGHVRYSQASRFLPFDEYHRLHPEIELEFIEGNSFSLKQKLTEGQIDLYFGNKSFDCSQMQTIELKSNALFAAISNDLLHTTFGSETELLISRWKNGIEMIDFQNVPYLSYLHSHASNIMNDYAVSHGFSWKVVSETASQNMNMDLCKKNMGFTIFDNSIDPDVPDEIYIFPIKDPIITYTLAFIRQDKKHERYKDDLWKLIQKKVNS